jgi:hypothetical protein
MTGDEVYISIFKSAGYREKRLAEIEIERELLHQEATALMRGEVWKGKEKAVDPSEEDGHWVRIRVPQPRSHRVPPTSQRHWTKLKKI